jgi:hypothetical protein
MMKIDNQGTQQGGGQGGDTPPAEQHDIAFAIDALAKKYEAAQSKQAQHDGKVLFWSRLAGIGVGIYTILTAIIVVASQRSADTARDALSLTFPPKIHVTSLQMWEEGKGKMADGNNQPPPWKVGTQIEGVAAAINYGREPAEIGINDCMFYWHKGHLPMNRPYFGIAVTNQIKRLDMVTRDLKEVMKTADPGQIGIWTLKTKVPADFKTKDLYVIGYILYKDRLGTHRSVSFARKYDPALGYFAAVKDDPDYESEE